MKKILYVLLIGICVLSLVACNSDENMETGEGIIEDQETKADEEILDEKTDEITLVNSWAFDEGFSSIATPDLNSNHGVTYIANNFYETLVNVKDGEIVPGLAESWEISEDGKVYTFNLKQGLKFTDGEDFNSDAVKTHLENVPTLLGIYNGSHGLVSALITEVEAIDENTVEINLSNAYYGALQDLSIVNPMGIMSPNAFNEDGTHSENIKETTLGTGPYMFKESEGKEKYTFIKNPNYHGEESEVDIFHVKIIPDNETKNLALRSGEIDLIVGNDKISYDFFGEISKDDDFEGKKSENIMRTRYLGLDTSKKPFDNKNVRLALNYVIDKESISKNIFDGIEEPADRLLNKNLPYCDVKVDSYEYDIEKAKKLLEDEGWIDSDNDGIREKDGEKLEVEILYITTGRAIAEDLVFAISSQAKEIGMEIKPVPLEMMAWYEAVQQGDYNIAIAETYGLPYDPTTIINNFRTEPMADPVLTHGLAHLEDQNSFINSITTLTDEEEIRSKYQEIFAEVYENAALIPITNTRGLVVYNSGKINDYEFLEMVDFANISGIKTE